MKTPALCLLAFFGIVSSLPAAEASKGPQTPMDAKAVQILFAQPAQPYEELGPVTAEKCHSKIKNGDTEITPLRGRQQLSADVLNALPDLQNQAAALGANAVILTDLEITRSGFVAHGGAPNTMRKTAQVSGTAIRLATPPASEIDAREFAAQLVAWIDSQTRPSPKAPMGMAGPMHAHSVH